MTVVCAEAPAGLADSMLGTDDFGLAAFDLDDGWDPMQQSPTPMPAPAKQLDDAQDPWQRPLAPMGGHPRKHGDHAQPEERSCGPHPRPEGSRRNQCYQETGRAEANPVPPTEHGIAYTCEIAFNLLTL